MIRHVVAMRFAPGATPAQREAIERGVRALVHQVPGVLAISCGLDAGLQEQNADFVVVADFEDEDGYLHYASHPAHRDLVASTIGPVLEARVAVQYHLEQP